MPSGSAGPLQRTPCVHTSSGHARLLLCAPWVPGMPCVPQVPYAPCVPGVPGVPFVRQVYPWKLWHPWHAWPGPLGKMSGLPLCRQGLVRSLGTADALHQTHLWRRSVKSTAHGSQQRTHPKARQMQAGQAAVCARRPAMHAAPGPAMMRGCTGCSLGHQVHIPLLLLQPPLIFPGHPRLP